MKIHIKNGRVIDPASQLDAKQDIYISGGKIVSIGDHLEGFAADRVIDATGLMIIPGLIDLSVRLREPGQEHTATIRSETAAASAGGVTTLCVPPDTDPSLTTRPWLNSSKTGPKKPVAAWC